MSARILRVLFRRADVEAEIDDEMRTHLELHAEELVRGGMSPADARRHAAIAFGGVQQQKEEALEQAMPRWLSEPWRNVRIAGRTLARNRTFAISASLALALAIAVNTTMFSVLDGMMNPAIGAKHPERLYTIKYFGDPRKKVDFRERERAVEASVKFFDAYTGWFPIGRFSIERGAHAEPARAAKVSPNFFAALEISPREGRLTPGTDAASTAASAVISTRLRGALFGANESPIGETISVDGKPFTVVGVTERYGVMEPLDFDVWTFTQPSEVRNLGLIRLKEDVSLEQAQRQLALLAAQLAMAADEPPKDTRFHLIPIVRQFHASTFHYALLGSGIAILLVACTNLANLQLARGLTRSGELAVRSSLGASRRQIVTQLVLESAVLAVAALVAALVLAAAGNAILRATIPPTVGELVVEPRASWRMVAFASLAAVVCIVAAGLLPAMRVSRIDLNSLLKGRAGTGAHRSNRRIYGVLVVVQIAFTLPLVCAAVLLAWSAARSGDMNFYIHERYGYDPTPLIRAQILFPKSLTPLRVSLADKAAQLVAHARALPGVANAAVIDFNHTTNGALAVDDEDGAMREVDTPIWGYAHVSAGYLDTFGLPLERGRDFQEGAVVEPTVIVDLRSAAFLWPRSSAVGRMIRFGSAHSDAPALRVEGVVGDQLSQDARDLRDQMSVTRMGQVYQLITAKDSISLQGFRRSLTLVVRASGNPADVAQALRRSLRGVSDLAPIVTLEVDDLRIPQRRIATRFFAGLFTIFAVLALGLSGLGVYAIVAQSVTDRQREVAVRLSLGATPKSIVYVLLREGNVLVLAGIALGLYLTKETVWWVAKYLDGVDLYSAPFFGVMCLALFAGMVLAALGPAIRATKLDPMQVLRAE